MADLYFQQLKCFNDCHDRSFTLPAQHGTGYFRFVCPRKGMLLYLEDYRLKRDVPVNVGSMYRPLLNLCYCISGRVDWTINSTAEPFITKGGNCEMFMTCFSSGAGTHCAGEPLVMVNIMIYHELFQSYFDALLDLMCRLDMKKLRVTGTKSVYHKYKIPGFMYRILKQVMQSPYLRPAGYVLRVWFFNWLPIIWNDWIQRLRHPKLHAMSILKLIW